MAKITKGMTSEEAAVKEIEVLQQLAERYAAIARGQKPSTTSRSKVGDITTLSIIDAAVSVLRELKNPAKPGKIAKVMLERGYEFLGEVPSRSVFNALRKGISSQPDLIALGRADWTLRSNHSPAKLQKLIEVRAGMGGRSRDEHIRRTKEGMAATGLKYGRKPKFTPADIAKFRKLVPSEEAGKKNRNVIAALAEVGMSTPYYYEHRDAIYAWKEGDPWPPPKGLSGDEMRAMGIIPLHAKIVGEK